ncbi:histidine kinase [Pedobacter sp. UBA4863]|uniref:sensor histidine kinase n=1 Tax=Pedobacter sp. UBA4863 TaxID=1947060 RepID=UPI0025CE02B3|nr:histidine kinase [Pedobacter sp. UBA4863]
MQMIQAYQQEGNRRNRILQHIAFWVSVWLLTSFVYGYEKQPLLVALKSNLMLLPVHMIYFYTLTYLIIPKYLLKRKYVAFFIILCLFVVVIPAITRIIDIFLVEPHINAYLKSFGYNNWEKVQGSKWQRFSNVVYYLNAVKGANFIVWFGVAVKFFKSWYQRHHAALQAELSLLKAQIHPHFLFNTLNNLYALTLNNSPKSPEIVMGLSEILRYMLYECNVESVSLKKDIEMLENFILLERMRYEERLDFNFTKEGDLEGHNIAPLLLLPLVENAFKHGAGEKVGQAWINMELEIKNELLTFKINNSKPEKVATPLIGKNGNIGLENVKKRLELIYPEAHQFKIFDEEELFAIILKIDLSKKGSLQY